VKAPCVIQPAHVERLPAGKCGGLPELVGRCLSLRARQREAHEVLDLFNVGRRLLVNRRTTESAVEQTDALGLTAQQVDQASVKTGESQTLAELRYLWGRFGRRQFHQTQLGS
jgi:hypothetical protein